MDKRNRIPLQSRRSGRTTAKALAELFQKSIEEYTKEDFLGTGVEKVRIAFRREKGWRCIIVERKTISTTNKITELADYGIAVTSETARNLVNFFYDIEQASGDLIPTRECVTNLGCIDRGDGAEFMLYVQDVVFGRETDCKK